MPKRYYKNNDNLQSRLLWIFGILFILWIVEAVNHLFGHSLAQYGILPRTQRGLIGILFSPFIHGSFSHLVVNSIPFIILGSLVQFYGKNTIIKISPVIIIVAGFAVWLFGRNAYHIGSSTLVFGYFGYLIARGWYDRKFSSIFIALFTIVFYGGMFFGILPGSPHISWEGHLAGFISGIACAKYIR